MRFLALIICLIWPIAAAAQDAEEDRGFIAGLLERSLGGEGRIVRIDGFSGAFSSTATIDQITVADTEGVWLTLREVEIAWNRSALLRGAIEVAKLTALEIDLARAPLPVPGAPPAPEAKPFALPELPASVQVDEIVVDRVSLGAPILGEAVEMSLSGAARLAGGTGDVNLNAMRTDGPVAQVDIAASFDNDTRALMIDLNLSEAAGGLASGLLNVPDRPSLDLTIAGEGVLSDFQATLALRSDGAPRLNGELQVGGGEDGPLTFDASLNGDVTALFLPEYRAFFGPNVRLSARGAQDSTGALRLDDLDLSTQALRISGQAALNADAWPTLLDLRAEIANASGVPVLLPIAGDPVRIDGADLTITFDAEQGDALQAQTRITGLDARDIQAEQLSLDINGTLQGAIDSIGSLAGQITIDSAGLTFRDENVARAVGSTVNGRLDVTYVEETPLRLRDMALSGATWALTGSAEIDAFSNAFETAFSTTLQAENLSDFAGLASLPLVGRGTVAASGTASLGGFFDIEIDAETEDLGLGIAQVDDLFAGITTLDLAASRDENGTAVDRLQLRNAALQANAAARLQTGSTEASFDLALTDVGRLTEAVSGPATLIGTASQDNGVWTVNADLTGPIASEATVTARLEQDGATIDLTANVPDISPVVPQIKGAADVVARAQQRDGNWQVNATVEGPMQAKAQVDARLESGTLSASYSANIPNVAPLVPAVSGPLGIDGTLAQVDRGWQVNADIVGPYASSGNVDLALIDSLVSASYTVSLPDVAPLVPAVSGPLGIDGTLAQVDRGWQVNANIAGPYASSGNVDLALIDSLVSASYTVSLPNVARLVPGLAGAADMRGRARQTADGFDIETSINGPSGNQARIAGLVRTDGTLDLNASGQAQLGLANPFLKPRNIVGLANVDLTVNGPPALSSVRGRITTQGARLAAPTLPLSFNDITGAVELNGAQAVLDLRAGVTRGGAIAITGPISLSGAFPANIAIGLNAVQVSDSKLYTSTINGGIRIDGALRGGARINGTIDVGETVVQVPSSGLSTFGEVPQITHIGATRPVMRTRDRAGLTQTGNDSDASGPAFPLDITVNAPARIFVRGRGIDAEVGGQLRLTGTTADMISTGQFDLIRGRMDILTKRFDLTEGLVRLQGRFEPFLRFVAATATAAGSAQIVIDGPADDPQVTFEAVPEAPQDEVLAQIFFGRDITQLSAFQALQLANAVATLAGRGGEGIVSRLRGSFALDNLDVSTDEEGNTAVRAGKYLSDNIYTDVTVGGTTEAEVSLNIDLTPNITVRGSVDADTNTSVGIFIEKDY